MHLKPNIIKLKISDLRTSLLYEVFLFKIAIAKEGR